MSGVLLIVDDEVQILSALRRTLRNEGHEILTADCGRDAVKFLAAQPVAAVLSDYKMPGMSGLEVLAEAARLQPKAARLLITGWSEDLDAKEAKRVGVHGVLSKPWDDRELKATLARCLEG